MKVSGIYKISSLIKPERFYIGSAILISTRWRVHKYELKRNTHHSEKLQRHYNKYGLDDLIFEIIQVCDRKDLIKIEQFYLDNMNPYFNNCKNARTRFGSKASDETKIKMSIARIGIKQKPISEEGRRNMSLAHIGYKATEEAKKNISLAMIGKNKGIPSWIKGKKQSPEWIAKRVAKQTGKKRSPEQIEYMQQKRSASIKIHGKKPSISKGTVLSEEHEEKIRLSMKKHFTNKKIA